MTTPATLATVREFVGRRFPGLKDAPLVGSEVCQYREHLQRRLPDRPPPRARERLAGGRVRGTASSMVPRSGSTSRRASCRADRWRRASAWPPRPGSRTGRCTEARGLSVVGRIAPPTTGPMARAGRAVPARVALAPRSGRANSPQRPSSPRRILVPTILSDRAIPDLMPHGVMLHRIMHNPFLSHLSDDQLTAEVIRLARSERETTAALVAHLVEFDSRRLYLGAGCRSLFVYCTEVLHLSEHGTYNRIEAGPRCRQFPVILEMLRRDGSLNLATVRLLAPHLTARPPRAAAAAAQGRSKREVQALVARHFPQPAVPALVRKLPVRTVPAPVLAAPCVETLEPVSGRRERPPEVSGMPERLSSTVDAPGPMHSPTASTLAEPTPCATSPALWSSGRPIRSTVTALAADRYQIRFTASEETFQKLRQAQELLGHSVPSGDVAAVVDRALSALIAELARKKLAATDRPRTGRRTSPGSRHIPAEVRRSVWQRDGGRCAFVAAGGRRCTARKPLEHHHVHPYGAGGDASIGNIELRCRSHNAYEAQLFYGADRHDDRRSIVQRLDDGQGIVHRPDDRPGVVREPGGSTVRLSDRPTGGLKREQLAPGRVGFEASP